MLVKYVVFYDLFILAGSDIDVECSPETQQELIDSTSSVLEENSGSPIMMGEV